jgi:hypothetical protein
MVAPWLNKNVEKSRSGKLKNSASPGWPKLPDSAGKVKKRKKSSVQQSSVAKSGSGKKNR